MSLCGSGKVGWYGDAGGDSKPKPDFALLAGVLDLNGNENSSRRSWDQINAWWNFVMDLKMTEWLR